MQPALDHFARRGQRVVLALAGAVLLASAAGCGLVQEGKAWFYGVQAYVYGFPLIVMDLTKDQGTAVAKAGEFTAPVNQFSVMTHYPDASFRAVPRTGLDTLFAVAWADLDKEPLVLSVPDTADRYDVIALFDMWRVDTKTPPTVQVQKMDAGAFFGRLARLMKDNPPAAADAPMVEKLKAIGITPGQDFDISKADPDTAKGLQRAMDAFALLQKGVKKLKTENGWIVIPKDFASYGTDYETRAGIALIGLGGIQPVDITYPTAFDDGDGKPLDAANRYVLHFDKGQTPPANVSWSISMYDPQGYYVPNKIDRYNLAAWMPLKDNPDGSLDIYIQPESPGADKEANWLPAPASGPFNLTIRGFWPKEAMLDGSYKLPPVKKVQ